MPIKEWIEIIEVSNPKTVSKKGAVSLRKSKKFTWKNPKNKKQAYNKVNKEENISEKLTLKQELFCQYYVKNESLRGNATLCYNEAYNINIHEKDTTRQTNSEWKEIEWTSEYDKSYDYCSMAWSNLIRNYKIQDRIDELWNELLIDPKIDARLSKIIYKWKDEVALNWIKEYNKLRNRIIENVKVSWEVNISSDQTINKLNETLERIEKWLR